jgi:chromosome partitioning protein
MGTRVGNVRDADDLRQRGWAILQRLQMHEPVAVPIAHEPGDEIPTGEAEIGDRTAGGDTAGGDTAGGDTAGVEGDSPAGFPEARAPEVANGSEGASSEQPRAQRSVTAALAETLGAVATVPLSDAAPQQGALVPEEEASPAAAETKPANPKPVNPFVRALPRVMAVANQKGGVGKTTTAVNVGAALAELGYRVLVVDLDPQGNATTGLGVNPRNLDTSIYDVIMRETPLEDCIEPTSLRNLFVAPATINLAGAEIELVPAFSRELKLRRALEQVMDDFDFILIDCPPSLGLLTVNGLGAASEVLVPIQCEYYALEGLGQLLRNVGLVQGQINPGLEVSAIVLTMYDARTKLAEQVAREVREHFGRKVCRNIVPRTVRLSEAPSFGQPIVVFDPTSRGAIAYREIAKEVSGGAPQRVG